MAARFTMDETRIDELADQLEIDDLWDPTMPGEEHTIVGLVYDAGVSPKVIVAPPGMTIHFEHANDQDGSSYVWLLDLTDNSPLVRLASSWSEMGLLQDGVLGIPAARSILQQAVDAANEMLNDFDTYVQNGGRS